MMQSQEVMRQRNELRFGTDSPVAFVTGSSTPRVGRVIAEQFAAEGFQIVIHGRRESEMQDLSPGLARLMVSGAIENESNVLAWTARIQEQFGRIDVLVNSAAIWQPRPLESTTADDFTAAFTANCLGTALACKHFGLRMCQQEHGGAIINIGDWAISRPYRDFSAYFCSKGAIPAATRAMAVELAQRNPRVRVNAILPGPVLLADSIDEQRRKTIRQECLLKRDGSPQDVAEAAVFLASAPFITGVCLPVDGGRSIYAGPSADPIAHPEYAMP